MNGPTVTSPRSKTKMHVPDLGEFRAFGKLARASTTLEVRWIHRGPVPGAMVAWLGPFDNWIERREDRYFVVPSVPDLGIKIRDNVQLDLKAFRGSLGKLTVPDVGRGRLELWEKWSFPLHASALPPVDAVGWLTLEKTRRRRSFEVRRTRRWSDLWIKRCCPDARSSSPSSLSAKVYGGRSAWRRPEAARHLSGTYT